MLIQYPSLLVVPHVALAREKVEPLDNSANFYKHVQILIPLNVPKH